MFPNSYLHYIKYRNLIRFPGDEIFCKRSVVRDNSLQLTLISEAAAWIYFSMAAFAKNSFSSQVAYKHFFAWRTNLIRYMLNKFKKELMELFFSYFFTGIPYRCFSRIFIKVYIVMASLKRHEKTTLGTLFSFSQ